MADPQQPGTSPSAGTGIWNLPNALTALRMVMVPFFGWALLVDGGQSITWRLVAYVLFATAMLTDKIDGDIARRRNLVTRFGQVADPIADKALTGMAFVGLSLIGGLWWWVTAVVLAREWGITLLRFWVMRHGIIAASRGGKLKTLLQTFALGLLILPLLLLSAPWQVLGQVLWWIAVVLMAAAVAVTVVTAIDYVVKALEVRRTGRAASD